MMATRVGDAPPPLTDLPDTDILLQHLRVGVIVAEVPSGRFLSVNRFAEQLWEGAMPNAASVEDYGDMFTGFRPDGRQYSHDEWPLARAVRYGEAVEDEEIEFRMKSGRRRIMVVSAAPVIDPDSGEATRAVALLHDVTDQRTEERRREFLLTLGDELRLLDDPAAIMEAAVSATSEYLGVGSVSYADVDPSSRYAVVHAEYRNGRLAAPGKYLLEDFGAQLVEYMRQGRMATVEDIPGDPVMHAEVFEGWGIRSLLAVPILTDGRLSSILTLMNTAPRRWSPSDVDLVRQVAERTWHAVETARSQLRLRQSREWLSLALRAGAAAIWEWDLSSGQIHWSEEHGSLLGTGAARRTLRFDRWLALVHPDDRAAARAAAARVATILDGDVEFEHRVNNMREPRWITMRGRVITGAGGAARRVVGIAVDSTERKLHELERERLLQQAREASDAKSHFISVLSHEFRTPLTAIIGYTDLLSTGVSGQVTPTQDRQLERIRASAWHLTQMVDQILSLSRIEAGHESIITEETDVAAVARESVALVSPTAAAKGLGVACELPDESPTIRSDSGKLRQVLLNLLGNAVKFTERGGVTLRVLPHDGAVEFVVLDTGVGIAPEHLDRIFERFWQASHDSGSRSSSGAGLGLTVSQHLVGLLGGTLTASSTPAKGSEFRFSLPRQA
jgi:signal transduction histidine kinase